MLDLVTGATGFIGSHLAERLLDEGREVRVVCRAGSESKLTARVREGAEIVTGDLRDPASLVRACEGAARVFHTAGHVLDWGKEEDFVALNVDGVRFVLEAAKRARAERIVHFSSFVVFGTPSPPEFDDTSPYGAGDDPYTRTKILGERIARDFATAPDPLPVVVLRPTVVYGVRGTWLEEPLAMAKKHKLFLLGGGRGTCHPCYVGNLVDAALLAAEHPRAVGRSFLVGDDDPVSFRDYFDAIASLAGEGPIRRSVPLPVASAAAAVLEAMARLTPGVERPLLTRAAVRMLTTESRMSMRAVREELGWTPRWSFREAMAEIARQIAARGG